MNKFLCLGALCLLLAPHPATAGWPEDVARLAAEKDALDPKAAAGRWVELATTLPATTDPRDTRERLQTLLRALPGPDAWPELRRQADRLPRKTQSDWALHTLTVFLHGTEAERWAALDAPLATTAAASSGSSSPIAETDGTWRSLWNLFRGLLRRDPLFADLEGFVGRSAALQNLQQHLLQTTADPDRLATALQQQAKATGMRRHHHLRLPNLLPLLDEARARTLLRELLRSELFVTFPNGRDTRRLAREVALEEMAHLQRAPWELTQDLDAGELFLALEQRFSPDKEDHSYREARLYHLYRLVATGRAAEAASMLQDGADGLPEPNSYVHTVVMQQLEQQGLAEEVHAFQRLLVDQLDPFPFWPSFARLSARLGHQKELMQLARRATEGAGAGTFPAHQTLFDCALAADEIPTARTAYDKAQRLAQDGKLKKDEHDDFARMAIRWFNACLALGRPAAETQAALRQARAFFDRLERNDYTKNTLGTALVAAFEKSGQVRDAEKVTATLLTETPQEESGFSFRTEPPAGLALAVEFLGRRGDHAGVLRLLEKDTRWRAADLAGILHAKGPLDATPMGFIAAQALLGSGRKDEGRAVFARLIREASPYDPAYELAFCVFAPEELGALLDRAAAADRFEERPLIWKAEWLRRAGRLDEALTVIKQAVAIDPSDGEIGKGRRMRAYVIWGRIAADQGDTKTATFMKGVEKTIRTAESADTLEDAGLSTRAITRYTESLKFFSDAYCIQSRLALRLSEEGRLQEAAAHYEKAFELMPDSFGRMESHCFGCEGAFRGQLAETTAERVFTRLLAKNPEKPQLHYLMGYLREQNRKPALALPHYLKAVELDPDYLNAWKKLGALADDVRLPVALSDAAAVRLLELDPSARHVQAKLTEMNDLSRMWKALENRQALLEPSAGPLFPLPTRKAPEPGDDAEWRFDFMSDHTGPAPTPEDGLIRHVVVRNLVRLWR